MKKIFFSASTYVVPKYIENYKLIVKLLKQSGMKVALNWLRDWEKIAKKYHEKGRQKLTQADVSKIINRKRLINDHFKAIRESDGLVAEISEPTVSVSFQIFYAMSHKKPVLALYLKDAGNIEEVKKMIAKESHLVSFKKYDKKNLPRLIKNFTGKQKIALKKFNFLITEEIEKYIDWMKKRQPDKSRSDLLREKILEEIIAKDNEFQSVQVRL